MLKRRRREAPRLACVICLTAGTAQETKGDAGPVVNDQDIANIVSQWTGIPIEKVQLNIATPCGFPRCPQCILHDAQDILSSACTRICKLH